MVRLVLKNSSSTAMLSANSLDEPVRSSMNQVQGRTGAARRVEITPQVKSFCRFPSASTRPKPTVATPGHPMMPMYTLLKKG